MIRRAAGVLSGLGPYAQTAEVRKAVVDLACECLGTGCAAVFTIDQYLGRVEAEFADQAQSTLSAVFAPVSDHFLEDVEGQDAWIVQDISVAPFDEEPARAALAGHRVRAMAAAPLRSKVGASGALVAFFTSPIANPATTAAVIEALAAQAASAISHLMTVQQSNYIVEDLFGENQELSIQATVDVLTGLSNHRALQQKLTELCRPVSGHSRRTFTLIMADVDHFKAYNDAYGHQEGDEVLRQVAQVIASGLRQGDFPARYGGEEFAVVIPGVGKRIGYSIADRLRRAVADQDYRYGALTISLGVAEFPVDGADVTEIIERADRALYQAKVTGRNRVVVAGVSPLTEEDAPPVRASDGSPSVLVIAISGQQQALDALERSGKYAISACDTVAQGSGLLASHHFDVVLVSTSRIGDSDIQSLALLCGTNPDVPVIVMPDEATAKEINDALRRGVVDVIRPQTSQEDLIAVLERSIAHKRSESSRNAERSAAMMVQASESLTSAVELTSPALAEHGRRVTSLALLTADRLGVTPEERHALDLAARLHDIGKLALPQGTLNKRSPLTEQEWRILREHPAQGARVVGAIEELSMVGAIIRHHHERPDGSGYPDGLTGSAIPRLSLIIAAASTYENLTSDQAGMDRLSPKQALADLRVHADRHFTPEIVAALDCALRETGQINDGPSMQRAA